MKNIYLVQVTDKYGPNSFLPVAISYQWMYASTSPLVRDQIKVADILIEKKNPRSYVESMEEEPNVMMLSSYVWNFEYNKELARLTKKKYPNCLIITGGPHIDKRDNKFFEKYPMFDIAVMGEGEKASKTILKRYLQNLDYDNIPSVFPKGGVLCELPVRIEKLDTIPSPILTGFYDTIINKVEAEHGERIWQVTYETLRGCPYKCTFCDIGDAYWQKIKIFDIDRIKLEIDWMAERKIEYVAVCDSNWGLLPRDVEITKYVIEKKKETGYPRFWDVTWAKTNSERIFEIAMLDKEADTRLFKGITFAMQSMNTPTLDATKRLNLKQEQALTYLEKYQKENIPTYSELIWPMPNETYDTLKSGIQDLINLGQKSFLMVHPLVVTYNATMGQDWYQKKHKFVTREVPLDTFYLSVDDLEDYIVEKTFVVVETSTAGSIEVIKGHIFSHLLIVMYYYGWGHYLLEYINKKFNINHISIVEKMLDFFNDDSTLIGSEIIATYNSLLGVFESNEFWGRQVLGDNDIFWEYKGASSIVFSKNRERLKRELMQFNDFIIGNPLEDVVDFNMDMCTDNNADYPIEKTYDSDTLINTIGIDRTNIKLNHWDTEKLSDIEFYHKAYHYQRKNQYWKNNITW